MYINTEFTIGLISPAKVSKKPYLLSDMIALTGAAAVDARNIFYPLTYTSLYSALSEGLKLVPSDGGAVCVYFIISAPDLLLLHQLAWWRLPRTYVKKSTPKYKATHS